MANRRITNEQLLRYLESSDEEPFSSGSDEEYLEEIEDTEVIANFIASSGRSTESPSLKLGIHMPVACTLAYKLLASASYSHVYSLTCMPVTGS